MYSNRSGSIGIYHVRIHPNPSESIRIYHIGIHQYPSEFIRINQSIIRIWRHTSSQPVRIYSDRSGSIRIYQNPSESIRMYQNPSVSAYKCLRNRPSDAASQCIRIHQYPSESIRIHYILMDSDGFWQIPIDPDRFEYILTGCDEVCSDSDSGLTNLVNSNGFWWNLMW